MYKSINKPIYLDYMATTPVDPSVVTKMCDCLEMSGVFGNPASTAHRYGWDAKQKIDNARREVADLIEANEGEIIWTSGATESNNLALKGAAFFYQRKGKHIISSKIEHKSVLDTLKYLETMGFVVTYLCPDKQGFIHPEQISQAIRPDTILLSIIHANNEMGVIQNIEQMALIAKAHGIIFHVDAAQSVGKIPINLKECPVDLMSFSAHKIYGPKGIGALFVRRKPRVRLEPQIHGGGHELGLRSGTLPTHQIVGMGEACRLAKTLLQEESERIYQLRVKLWQGICDLGGLQLHGDWDKRLPGNLNVGFAGVEGESLLLALHNLAVSTGAACNSATLEPSYVLQAIGCKNELANSSVRFSIGRFTTDIDIEHAITHIREAVSRLRQISPVELA